MARFDATLSVKPTTKISTREAAAAAWRVFCSSGLPPVEGRGGLSWDPPTYKVAFYTRRQVANPSGETGPRTLVFTVVVAPDRIHAAIFTEAEAGLERGNIWGAVEVATTVAGAVTVATRMVKSVTNR